MFISEFSFTSQSLAAPKNNCSHAGFSLKKQKEKNYSLLIDADYCLPDYDICECIVSTLFCA